MAAVQPGGRLVPQYLQNQPERHFDSHRFYSPDCYRHPASILLNKTRPGRYIVALGSNSEATRLSGVNIAKWRTLAYIISGTLAGLAGLAYASIYSTILPGGGGGFELDAIAGVVIGGTSMSGGYGTISGTLIGVFIMSVLKTGLPFVGLQSNWQQAVTGVVLVFAVFMDVMNRQKKKKV